jgi:hypothetical protein
MKIINYKLKKILWKIFGPVRDEVCGKLGYCIMRNMLFIQVA